MKKTLITSIVAVTLIGNIFAGSLYWVNGYSKSDGSYVSGHFKTTPDAYKWNNLSY